MNAADWNNLIATLPEPHILQTWEWAQVKARFGWQPSYLIWSKRGAEVSLTIASSESAWTGPRPGLTIVAAALVLQRTVPILGLSARLRVLYISKGPMLDWRDAMLRHRVLDDLHDLARQRSAIFIKIDPDVHLGTGVPGQPGAREDSLGQAIMAELEVRGWRYSDSQVQFRNTVLVDLSASEEQLLSNMKQKTRYNVRLAEKKGVVVRTGTLADLDLLYQMYAETSLRDGFVIRKREYYRTVWTHFFQAGMLKILIATVLGESDRQPDSQFSAWTGAVAAVLLFQFAGKAWYLYGMSLEAHRDKMPNHLLQWEAIRQSKAAGCRVYDMWGAPDEFGENDPLWGVFRFKAGFGGMVVRSMGAWDLPGNALFYKLYTQTLPRLLDIMRRRGKASTAQSVIPTT